MPKTKEQTIARQQREIERLKALLQAATRRQDAAYRVYGPEQDAHMVRLTVPDDIIGNPRRLHAVTLCTAEQFDYILHRYIITLTSGWSGATQQPSGEKALHTTVLPGCA